MTPEPTIRNDRRLAVLSSVGLIVIWHVASLLGGRSPLTHQRLVPGAVDLVRSFDRLAFYCPGGLGVHAITPGSAPTFGMAVLALIYNSLATALRLFPGLALGATVSVSLAALIGWSRPFRRMFVLPSHIMRMFPLLALAPLFNLWFGSTEPGAISFIALGSFAILFVSTLTAIASVPSSYSDYARSLGASRTRAYLTVVLPAGLPALRGGLLLALGFGWSLAIGAEFVGESTGLGNIINQAQQFGQTDTIALVGAFVMLYGAFSCRLAARVLDHLTRWAE